MLDVDEAFLNINIWCSVFSHGSKLDQVTVWLEFLQRSHMACGTFSLVRLSHICFSKVMNVSSYLFDPDTGSETPIPSYYVRLLSVMIVKEGWQRMGRSILSLQENFGLLPQSWGHSQ